MSMHNYYTVLQQQSVSPTEYLFTVQLNVDCEVYKGHFPNQPVAPGACQLQIVKECASIALGRPIRLTTVKQCKFLRTIIPTQVNILDILLSFDENNSLSAQVRAGEITYVKIKAQVQ